MRIKISLLLTALAFIAMPLDVEAAQAASKIGVINLQGALNGTKQGKKVLVKMKKNLIKESKIMKKKQQELINMQKDLKKQAFMLSEPERMKRQSKLLKLSKEFERYREDRAVEFRMKQSTDIKKIYERLVAIINKYAKKEGFTVIFEAGQQAPGVPGSIVYHNDAIDITKKVIALYDKKY